MARRGRDGARGGSHRASTLLDAAMFIEANMKHATSLKELREANHTQTAVHLRKNLSTAKERMQEACVSCVRLEDGPDGKPLYLRLQKGSVMQTLTPEVVGDTLDEYFRAETLEHQLKDISKNVFATMKRNAKRKRR